VEGSPTPENASTGEIPRIARDDNGSAYLNGIGPTPFLRKRSGLTLPANMGSRARMRPRWPGSTS